MQAPTANRKTGTTHDAGSTHRIERLAAAISAETMKNLRGSKRSASPRTALVKVPATKPAETLLDIREAWRSLRPYSSRREGRTAEAENHSVIASTSHKASSAMDTHLPPGSMSGCAVGSAIKSL